jgi:hypothetical protein
MRASAGTAACELAAGDAEGAALTPPSRWQPMVNRAIAAATPARRRRDITVLLT